MEFILNRYRNLTVLLVVIVAQLLLIAFQVKTRKDVPFVRVWAVTVVTPLERLLEVVRRNTWVFVEDYFVLVHTRGENDKLRSELGRVKLENLYLKGQLSMADRAQALGIFQVQAPSRMVAARIIGNGAGANSKIVFVDRGSGSGVQAGMAVVTPDGIIGKVVRAYPTASLVQMMTDGNFAAGVVSQKNHVRGTMKGQGHDGTVTVDFVQNQETVDVGEWFYTSGDDLVFPKGFPVGPVAAVRNGKVVKEIYVTPSGFQNGTEQVLIVVDGVHQDIPEIQIASPGYKLLPRPPLETSSAEPGGPAKSSGPATDADRLKEQYRQLGVEEKHVYGEGGFDKPPDFTKLPPLRGGESKKDAAAAAAASKAAPVPVPGVDTPAQSVSRPAAVAASPAKVPVKTQPEVPLIKTKPDKGTVGTAVPPAANPKPRSTGPLLITDPTDADPTDPGSRLEKSARPASPELNEMGEPKLPKAPANRVRAIDRNTELLPDAPRTRKAKPDVTKAPAPPDR
ncbi:MAG: hypothetical protein M3Z32_01115 [Acidobacteriota bacterium]|nr:hypothetical protein [Acidobacteriota bacterium]